MADGNLGLNMEDVATMVASIDTASPADKAKFLQSIKNTPTEAILNTVVEFINLPADQKAAFGNPPEAKAEQPKQ